MNGEWPDHFPPDCPPQDAGDVDRAVFYLIAHDPPQASDFLSALERGAFKGNPICGRAGLSCGVERNYVESLRNDVPRLRPMHVAVATLKPEQGKLKQTGKPGHHSLWLRREALAAAPTLFRVADARNEA